MIRTLTSLFLAVALVATAVQADHYAVLIAGSHGYQNYRHHADVCHAYQIMLKQGIPAKNIILMMYDDVAQSWQNPFKGKLFNQPTQAGTPGTDVYAGCVKDYTKGEVNAKNFIAVITGDKDSVQGQGTGRVLESTNEDRVFINFVDHGGTGLIAMPNPPYLYKDKLHQALQTMYQKKMYKELVFYVEACESGSMFEGLDDLKDMNIYITTAANGQESSWGTYCPPNDKVNGKDLHTCLGDLYSVNWMENADSTDLTKETLEKQYQVVKQLTNKSHVQQFGTQNFTDLPAADFEGDKDLPAPSNALRTTVETQLVGSAGGAASKEAGNVDSRDIAIVQLYHRYMRTGESSDARRLIKEIESRENADAIFKNLVRKLHQSDGKAVVEEMLTSKQYTPKSFDCHRAVNAAYDTYCGGYTDYSLKHTRVVVNLCERGNSAKDIVSALKDVCRRD